MTLVTRLFLLASKKIPLIQVLSMLKKLFQSMKDTHMSCTQLFLMCVSLTESFCGTRSISQPEIIAK